MADPAGLHLGAFESDGLKHIAGKADGSEATSKDPDADACDHAHGPDGPEVRSGGSGNGLEYWLLRTTSPDVTLPDHHYCFTLTCTTKAIWWMKCTFATCHY